MKRELFIILMCLAIFSLSCFSQVIIQGQPQKKIALVIGNGNYQMSTLPNPENDAKAMKAALQSVGFTVMEYENLSQNQMKKAIDDFGDLLKNFEVGLFYYAGHGIQDKGYNYLIPVDAQLKSEEEVEYDCVPADRILAKMEASGSKVNIIILDACRNNPFERSWTRSVTGRGLAFMNAPRGSLIAYATSPGSTASDGSSNNGLYTSAILESMKIPGITILEMFQNVRNIVSQKSDNQQTPWESTSLTGNFYFNPTGSVISETRNIIQPDLSETSNNNAENNTNDNIFFDPVENRRYKTVKIGEQIWMAENLSTVKFNDGTDIPLVTDKKEWRSLTMPAYCWYNNDQSNSSTYGALYNWYTVNTGKLCPKGWHVPHDSEWSALFSYLGGLRVAGGKLKGADISIGETNTNSADNKIGFTALPGGSRLPLGNFADIGFATTWWSLEGDWSPSIVRLLKNISKDSSPKRYGLSVRCIRDN